MHERVAIIGSGPSGLSLLHAFQTAKCSGEDVPEIVCFESQDDWGGLWNYTWKTGVDEYGVPIHNSMYRHLWSNGPKECLEFADYSFEEHFGQQIGSFPPRAVISEYIRGRGVKSGFRHQIRFLSLVSWVDYKEDSGKFDVKVRDLTKDRCYTETFDYVIVATGHFSCPHAPTFDGFQTFNGRILHAHDFRDALEFLDMDVLIIGSSYSAEDIGSQCYKYGSKSITISHRTTPTGRKWPSTWQEVPLLTHVEGNVAYFNDGFSKHVDAIILCTGYQYNFSFLPDDLRLRTSNRLWPPNLYKGVFWEDNPRLMYLGMQDQYYTFTMFDAQAWYARDVILGRKALPSRPEMTAHSLQWSAREEALNSLEKDVIFQGDYIKDLLVGSDCPPIDIDATNKAFLQWEDDKTADIMMYRDKSFCSAVTGKVAPPQCTAWLDQFDDSTASYLSSVPVDYSTGMQR